MIPTKREDYWIHILIKTKVSMGLNIVGRY